MFIILWCLGQKRLLVCPHAIFENSIWFKYCDFTFQCFFWISRLQRISCFVCTPVLKIWNRQLIKQSPFWSILVYGALIFFHFNHGPGFQTLVGSIFVNTLIAGKWHLAIRRLGTTNTKLVCRVQLNTSVDILLLPAYVCSPAWKNVGYRAHFALLLWCISTLIDFKKMRH